MQTQTFIIFYNGSFNALPQVLIYLILKLNTTIVDIQFLTSLSLLLANNLFKCFCKYISIQYMLHILDPNHVLYAGICQMIKKKCILNISVPVNVFKALENDQ